MNNLLSNIFLSRRCWTTLAMVIAMQFSLAASSVSIAYAASSGGHSSGGHSSGGHSGGSSKKGGSGGHDDGHDDSSHDDDSHDDSSHDSGSKGKRGKGGIRGGKGNPQGGGSRHLEDRVFSDDGGTTHGRGSGGGKKGDDYGDLWVVLRDANGVPILFKDADSDGTYDAGEECTTSTAGCFPQPYYIDANNNIVLIQLDVEGHPLVEDQTIEVEFGRLNVGRAPSKVLDKSLGRAIDAILQTGAVLSMDASGRIVITVDGVSKTIDSPLENIALYTALMTDGANLPADLKTRFDTAVVALSSLYSPSYNKMDMSASLLAAGADKTSSIGIDMVAYLNNIYDIATMTPTDFIDYSTFDYNRSSLYNVMITYNELNPDGSTTQVTGTILDLVFGGVNVTDTSGIDSFSQAADDALQVIEFVHEVIHDLQP